VVSGTLSGQQFRWYRLHVEKGKTYRITTFGLSEPFAARFHLFDPRFTLLDYQYGNPGAKLTFTAEETTPHYFYVRALNPGSGGSYGVRVRVEGGVGPEPSPPGLRLFRLTRTREVVALGGAGRRGK
jgi:hypothetical protein